MIFLGHQNPGPGDDLGLVQDFKIVFLPTSPLKWQYVLFLSQTLISLFKQGLCSSDTCNGRFLLFKR